MCSPLWSSYSCLLIHQSMSSSQLVQLLLMVSLYYNEKIKALQVALLYLLVTVVSKHEVRLRILKMLNIVGTLYVILYVRNWLGSVWIHWKVIVQNDGSKGSRLSDGLILLTLFVAAFLLHCAWHEGTPQHTWECECCCFSLRASLVSSLPDRLTQLWWAAERVGWGEIQH